MIDDILLEELLTLIAELEKKCKKNPDNKRSWN